jgi:hypothetical protein
MTTHGLIPAACGLLETGAHMVAKLDADFYARPHPGVLGSSFGGHFRHALDHFRLLLDGADGGRVDYDRRERQTPVETDPRAAAAEAKSLIERLRESADRDMDRPLATILQIAPGEPAVVVQSTFARELAFCYLHAIHHYAFIRVLADGAGPAMPEGFGVAPATLAYRAGTAS